MLKKIIRKVRESVSKQNERPTESPVVKKSRVKSVVSEPSEQVWKPGDSAEKKATQRRSRSRGSSAKPSQASRVAGSESESDKPSRPPRQRRSRSEEQRPSANVSTESPAESKTDGAATASDQPAKRRRRRRRSPRQDPGASGKVQESSPSSSADNTPPDPVETREFKPKNISAFDGQLVYEDMDIPDELKKALREMHFAVTTPIQARLLPLALAGNDAAGKAQTGTGKTAAFLISMFTRFLRSPLTGERPNGTPRALVLAPTRELALQIQRDALDIGRYSGLCTVAVYGGMDFNKQQRELEEPVDLIVATPGRLMDFASRKVIDLRKVEVLVIDEADRMLDMGFIPDVRKIVRMTPHPEKRQTLLFSATLTPNIVRLAEQWTRQAETIEIEPENVASESVNQRVIITTQEEKFTLLYNLLQTENPDRVLIFSNRRDQAEMLCEHLNSYGFVTALLSGAVDQRKRVRVLDDFKSGKVKVLVATDVAGRGLHVEGISHVINYHMPLDPDDYVHRIGRTGRAGEIGTSISFACEVDSFEIPNVEAYIGRPLVCEHPTDELLKPIPPPNYKVERKPRRSGPPQRGGGGGGGRGGRRGGSSGPRRSRVSR